MIGIDTSFLVAFEIGSHPENSAARSLAKRYSSESFGLAPQVLAEFIHVVTDPKRFERPLSFEAALDRADRWWNASEIIRIFPTNDAVELFALWMREFNLGRKRILDTMLAATYKAAGISIIASTNARDFARFPGVHPLESQRD
ncbi:type II toxin-antitoxin system VapC family toxin [Salinispira pacifica]